MGQSPDNRTRNQIIDYLLPSALQATTHPDEGRTP